MGQLGRALAARVVQAGIVAVLVGTVCFALMHALPGDFALRIAAARYGPDMVSQAAAEQVRAELGLDRPLAVQLAAWLGQIARFDLGHSLVSGEPVVEEIALQLGYTLWLSAVALLGALLLGPPLGALAGLRAGGVADRALLAAAALLRALPAFIVGLVLMLVFSVALGWLPPAGFGGWREMALPALTLALGLAAASSRVSRDAVAEVARTPYFRHAGTKGLPRFVLLWRHGLRNAAIPVAAYVGLQAIYLVEGVMVVESIFSYPGIGHALVHAVVARDIPVVQGTALAMAFLFVLLNALVDLACRGLDPRLRAA